jgi:hypothetical protein
MIWLRSIVADLVSQGRIGSPVTLITALFNLLSAGSQATQGFPRDFNKRKSF